MAVPNTGPMLSGRRLSIGRLSVFVGVMGLLAASSRGDDLQSPESTAPTELPASFERFRQVFFFQSQAAELLPPTFRPIDITELEQRLQVRDDGNSLSPVDSPQLIRAVYVARFEKDRLVSTHSHWDISYRGQEPARLSLGQLGLALRPENGEMKTHSSDSIVSNLSGESSVLVKGDTRLGFAWTAAGTPIDRGTSFDLKIPASMQTRVLVEVPRDTQLAAIDGVGRKLPSPPPEAGPQATLAATSAIPTSWYSIDAGGLTRVRLRLVSGERGETESILPVRQASVQYDLLPQSIRFTARLVIDSRPGAMLPVLSIHHGQATSVRIGGSVVPWTEVTGSEGLGIRIDTTRLDPTSSNGTVNITVEGETPWNPTDGPQALPWPRWQECRPLLIATEMQAQVRVDSSLSALRLQLPSRWRFSPTATAEDGARLFRCVGPLVDDGISVLVKPDQKQISADSVLRLMATTTQFQAQLDTSIAVSDLGPQPITFQMDRNWTADLVTLPGSGRVIDLPNDPVERRTIVIWPTSDELIGRRLQIRITGSMPLRSGADRIEFPATSFATIKDCRTRVVALITPPVGFNWTGDVALRTTRVKSNQLSAIQQSMIGELAADSLLIEVNEGRISPLVCRRPDISFDATSRLALRTEGGRLRETYLVACDSVSTEIQTIVVDLGESARRPPMQWSALRADGSSRRITAATLIAADGLSTRESAPSEPMTSPNPSLADVNASEVWRLELGETGERSVMLVGRREYKFDSPMQIPLPMVPGASNQTAQVVVMPSLSVTRLGNSVLKVPRMLATKIQIRQYGAIPEESDPIAGSIVLRYDPAEKAAIELSLAPKVNESPVIWRETVRIVASNRGGDAITASYDLEPHGGLLIDHEVNLRLVSVMDQDGNPISHESEPTLLRVKPSQDVTRIVTAWTRSVFSGSIARRWTAPRISAVGVVLRRDWQMMPAPDTLVPASVLLGTPMNWFPTLLKTPGGNSGPGGRLEMEALGSVTSKATIEITPDHGHAWVIDSSVGYAVSSMIGLCMFAFGWWLATRSPFLAAILWVCSIVPPVFLFAPSALWMSTICAPIATGGLLAMTLVANVKRWNDGTQPSVFRSNPKPIDLRPPRRESSGELHQGSSRTGASSWTGRLPMWFVAVVVPLSSSWSTIPANAQASPLPVLTPEDSTTPVLVPTDAEGGIVGTKVYVPSMFFDELFREQAPVAALTRVKSATYRLRLTGSTESETTADLEVRYQLDDAPQRTEVRLPIRASQLRSVSWLTDADSRPLRWSPDGEDAVRLNLPTAVRASLLIRVTGALQVTSRTTRRIRFPIPPIANATLVVDAGFAVQRLDLAQSVGEVESQPELGRLNAAIGSVGEVDLMITYREAVRTPTSIAQRRYWVHAGFDRTHIECEVELSDPSVRKGGQAAIVLVDGELPVVMTNDWTIAAVDASSPVRRQLTMQAQRDNPGPIRFLWELGSLVASTSDAEDAVPIVIPDVLSAGTAITPPAAIALDAAQGLRLVPKSSPQSQTILPAGSPAQQQGATLANDSLSDRQASLNGTAGNPDPTQAQSDTLLKGTTSPQTIDAFIASWKGFRGTASEVVTSPSPLTRFIIAAPSPRPWQAEEIHHLHVRPGELQLSYAATITPGDRLIGPLRVVMPAKCELRVLTMNGISVDSLPHDIGNHKEISLMTPPGPDVIQLRVVVHMRMSQNGQFTPPLIGTEPVPLTKGTYTLSRDQSLLVEEVVDGGLTEARNPAMGTDQQLSGGWVPCWTWRLDGLPSPPSNEGGNRPQLPGRFRVLPREVAISSQQRTSLVWNQTSWSIETLLRLKGSENSGRGNTLSREPIDFVNVELPTLWCENLTVEPAEAWSRQPSIDPATQIVRIRPKQGLTPDGVITIRLQGQRSVDSDARLEVPAVRVLGAGKREVFVTVPRRIDGREIAWEAVAASPATLPKELLRVADPLDLADRTTAADPVFNPKDQLVFRSVSGNASVRLAPSRLEVTNPKVTVADIQLFAEAGKQTTMIYRWDLCPGREEQIAIDLPSHIRPVEVKIDNEPTTWTESGNQVDVRLALSRLAQSVTLICRLESLGDGLGLPKLREVPVEQTWMTVYESVDEAAIIKSKVKLRGHWKTETAEDRLLSQVMSIREVTEASLSRATDRAQEEIVRWIGPWDQRFRALVKQSASAADNADEESDYRRQWSEQEQKWSAYLRRVAGETAPAVDGKVSAMVPPSQWRVVSVASHVGQAESLPGVHILAGTKTLAVVIQSLLTLILTGGLALLMWRGRYYVAPLAGHPAGWMFATGLASFAVAPFPVALAICGVAIAAPLLNSNLPQRH